MNKKVVYQSSIPSINWDLINGNAGEIRILLQEEFPQEWKEAEKEIRHSMEKRGIWGIVGRSKSAHWAEDDTRDETTYRVKVRTWLDNEISFINDLLTKEKISNREVRTASWPYLNNPRGLIGKYSDLAEDASSETLDWEYERNKAKLITQFWLEDVLLSRARDLAIKKQREQKTLQSVQGKK